MSEIDNYKLQSYCMWVIIIVFDWSLMSLMPWGYWAGLRRRGNQGRAVGRPLDHQNKMSIEYQLYQMANTNQIIIPTLTCLSPQQQRHFFPPCPLSPTPRKPHTDRHLLPWKKTNSAFQKYKDRKDKRVRPLPPSSCQLDEQPSDRQPCLYKLVIKAPSNKEGAISSASVLQLLPLVNYFDPNLAPLCGGSCSPGQELQLFSLSCAVPKIISKSCLKMQQEGYEKMPLKKIQSLCHKRESEPQQSPFEVIAVRDDDPFIILRKDSRLKLSSKSYKTKYLKKQKHCPKEPSLANTEHSPISRLVVPKDLNQLHMQLHSQASLFPKAKATPNAAYTACTTPAGNPRNPPTARTGFTQSGVCSMGAPPGVQVIQISSSCEVGSPSSSNSWKQQRYIRCD